MGIADALLNLITVLIIILNCTEQNTEYRIKSFYGLTFGVKM